MSLDIELVNSLGRSWVISAVRIMNMHGKQSCACIHHPVNQMQVFIGYGNCCLAPGLNCDYPHRKFQQDELRCV